MFGIGMPELIIILVIALIVIGPSKLPDLAKALGKGMAEFKKATQEIKESLDVEEVEEELKEAKEDLVDSISGLDKPLDLEPSKSDEVKKQEHEDFDEMLEDYEETKDEPQQGEKKLGKAKTDKEKSADEQ